MTDRARLSLPIMHSGGWRDKRGGGGDPGGCRENTLADPADGETGTHPHPLPHPHPHPAKAEPAKPASAGHEHPHPHPHPHEHDDGSDGHSHGADDHGHSHDGDGEHGHSHGPGGHSHATSTLGKIYEMFVGHSHDPGDQIDEALESNKRGIRALKLSLIGLAVTATLQLLVFAISNSVGLLADTIHNFADALTAVPLWIAFILGARAANRRYTFGYRRAEDLAGLFILLMIALSSIIAAAESVIRLVNPEPVNNLLAVAAAGFIGFLGNELVAVFRIREGKAIGSAALVADGYHARTDGLTSLAVVVGAGGVYLGFPLADPIVGLLISITIILVLKQATSQVLARLMDAIDPAMVTRVEELALSVEGVQAVDRVRLRWLGHSLEAGLAITVDAGLTVAEGHVISEKVRGKLFHRVRRLETAIIHVDPSGAGPEQDGGLTHHHDQPTRHEAASPA